MKWLTSFLSIWVFIQLAGAKNNDRTDARSTLLPMNIVHAIDKFKSEINYLNRINKTLLRPFGLVDNSYEVYENVFTNLNFYSNQSHNVSRPCVEQLEALALALKNQSVKAISGKK